MKKQGLLKYIGIILAAGILFAGFGSSEKNAEVEKGMQAIEAMDYETAMNSFSKAEELKENPRLIARGRGIACMGQTDYEKAVEYFLECMALSNGVVEDMDYDVNFYLAASYQKLKKYQEAIAVYDAILGMHSGDTDAYYLRGNAYLSLGKYEEAKLDFDQVIKREPYNYNRLIQIYEVLRAAGYKDMGDEYLRAALSEKEKKMNDYEKGRIQFYLEDFKGAQVSLEQAKAEKGAEADVYLYLGMAYEATGDYNYAITNVYNAYLSQKEGTAALYNQLGLCYLKQEQYDAALEAFQSAMQIPDNGMMQTLKFNEIVAYEYLNEFEQATILLDNYLKIYPDDEQAKREYGFLSTR